MNEPLPILVRALEDFTGSITPGNTAEEMLLWFDARLISPSDLRDVVLAVAPYATSKEAAVLCGIVIGWQAHVALLAEDSP